MPQAHVARLPRRHPAALTLADVPSGTPVLVRGDVDAKPGAKVGDGDIRLRSMVDTLAVRHRPRLEADHLRPHRPQAGEVAGQSRRAAGRDAGCDVPLIADWLDEVDDDDPRRGRRADRRQPSRAASSCSKTPAGTTIERVLWKAKADDCRSSPPQLAQVRQRVRRQDRQGLRQRSPLGRQPRRSVDDRAAGDGPRRAGQLRRRRVRRPDAALPRRRSSSSSAA